MQGRDRHVRAIFVYPQVGRDLRGKAFIDISRIGLFPNSVGNRQSEIYGAIWGETTRDCNVRASAAPSIAMCDAAILNT